MLLWGCVPKSVANHPLGKGSKRRTVLVSPVTLELFQGLGRRSDEEFVFPSPRRHGHLTRQAIGEVCRKWGKAAGFHVHPHQLRQSQPCHTCCSASCGRLHPSGNPGAFI
ncbi:tyrosine-type recombinase/integrase [Synechococcus sp. MIT S9508]|uniref:tyrosine-type recombinase/integrase n=1 Tax=Synechococcus sp. MIT S9508 TaxID=1801629 RepID=UPI0009418694